jgi:hypothetical protein
MPSWYKRIIGPAVQVLRIDKAGFGSQLQDNVQILTGRKKIVYHKFTRSHGNYSLDLQATERKVKSKKGKSAKGSAVSNGNLLDPNRPISALSSQISSQRSINIASEVDSLFGSKLSSAKVQKPAKVWKNRRFFKNRVYFYFIISHQSVDNF